MIDLHMHTIFSDGVLVPAELCQRARAKGYRGMAITDHVDASNFDTVVSALVRYCKSLPKSDPLRVAPGMELTHVLPEQIAGLVKKGRSLGAGIVVMHGETPVEPVPPGTNLAAIKAGVDILAHPGLISEEEVKLAAKNRVALEITSRKGHCLTNGHVAALARKCGAALILNTDSHEPEDLITPEFALTVARGAGLTIDEFKEMLACSEAILKKALRGLPLNK